MFSKILAAPIVGLLLLTGATAVPVSSSSGEQLHVAQNLGENGWAAVRFNITLNTDLSLAGRTVTCETGVARGAMSALLLDGLFVPTVILPAWDVWTPFDGLAEVAHDGDRAVVAAVQPTRACATIPLVYDPWFSANNTVVVFGMIGGSSGQFVLDATWTHGVTSWDIVEGTGTALTKAMFAKGTSVQTYTFAARVDSLGIHAGAGAAAGLSHTQTTTKNAVGYFAPVADQSLGTTEWSCTVNQQSCQAPQSGIILLSATTGAEWSIRVDFEARARTIPYYALMLLEFPDNTFLR